jgi:hypothetical protein
MAQLVTHRSRGGLFVLAAAELAVPVVAERRGGTPWHPHHITERYGLFTLILLGQSLLASTNAIIEALSTDQALAPLISIAILAFVVTAALWWIYFWPPARLETRILMSSTNSGSRGLRGRSPAAAAYSRRIPDRVAVTSSCAVGDRCPLVRCSWLIAAPYTERRDRVGPLPRLNAGIGGVDEVRGDGDRVCRRCDVPFSVTPAGKASPCGGRSFWCPPTARTPRRRRSASPPPAGCRVPPPSTRARRCPQKCPLQVFGLVRSPYR